MRRIKQRTLFSIAYWSILSLAFYIHIQLFQTNPCMAVTVCQLKTSTKYFFIVYLRNSLSLSVSVCVNGVASPWVVGGWCATIYGYYYILSNYTCLPCVCARVYAVYMHIVKRNVNANVNAIVVCRPSNQPNHGSTIQRRRKNANKCIRCTSRQDNSLYMAYVSRYYVSSTCIGALPMFASNSLSLSLTRLESTEQIVGRISTMRTIASHNKVQYEQW